MCFNFCFCLVRIPIGITSSEVRLKICAITASIKNYKSIIKKNKQYKKVLLAKSKLSTREVLISMALTDLYISQDKFVSIKNVLRKY